MVKAFALGAGLLAAIGCSGRREDQAELIRATLATHHPRPVIVLPAELPAATQWAARMVGATIAQARVPASPQWRVPPGYFVLERVKINGSRAEVVGLFGPVPAPRKAGVGLLSCGTHVRVQFERVAGSWQRGVTEQIVC